MINVHSAVNRGFMVNQDGQFDINELIARGGDNVAIMARNEQDGRELTGGLGADLPSLIQFCKRILIETGSMPKWFYIGVIVDSVSGQILTYFSPDKEKFFSDIYRDIKDNLLDDLTITGTETVVKNFFEQNLDYRFNYQMIPLDTLLGGSHGGIAEASDIRF